MQYEEDYRELLKGHALLRCRQTSPERQGIRFQGGTSTGRVEGAPSPVREFSFLRQVSAGVQPAARIAAERLRRVQEILREASQGHHPGIRRRTAPDKAQRNCNRKKTSSAAFAQHIHTLTAVPRRVSATALQLDLVQLWRIRVRAERKPDAALKQYSPVYALKCSK
jgi:hypothetical protein